MPSGRAIGIVTKAPVAGNVKTRLAGQLGAATAADLYMAFLRDALVTAAAVPNATVAIFHPPNDDTAVLERVRPPGVQLRAETGTGYTEILPNALRSLLDGAEVAALAGADSPSLPGSLIVDAFDAVESGAADVAICPATDGGYCLLATNSDYPSLFESVDWSTARVFDQMRSNAQAAGLRLHALPPWYDIDDVAELEQLASDLAADVTLGGAATRRLLRRLRDGGTDLPGGTAPWTVHTRTQVFESPWRSLVSDRLTTHQGAEIDYAYLETECAVWVVPVTDDGRIVLVRQYRHPIGEIILEVPAGGGDDDPLDVAARELREETGGVAKELTEIASYYPASAHTTHIGHVVLALGVEFGARELEATELLEPLTVPCELAFDMARRGEIGDSQSALAILAAEPAIRAALREDVPQE